jgi:2-polyprenyl-3-methyl-5-hydroxy-6-metoxy-1,4-benzoquinol methylase
MNKEQFFDFREINCPVCESGLSKVIGYRGGEAHQNNQGVKTTIVRCRNCTHLYPNPMPFPKIGLDELYTNADEYFQNHNLEEKKLRSLDIMKNFEKHLGRKGRFLDVGCGRGELVWAAKELDWEVEGIDPSKEFVEFGRKFLGVNTKVGILEDGLFQSNSFDAVALGGIIEHLYNPKELLKVVHSILKPDGWFWFDAPNEDGLYMKIGNLYMRLLGRNWVVVLAPTFSPYHVQGFNKQSLKALMQNSDFEVKELNVFGQINRQTGTNTTRKKIEYHIAKGVNWIGNTTGNGMYMDVWAQKK